jgi:hypothetical protein
MPPKEKPTAATRPSAPGQLDSAARPRLRPAYHEQRIVPQRMQAADDTVPAVRHAVPEHVTGQDNVSQCRVAAGLLAGVLIQTGASVDEHDARPGAGERLVRAEYAGQRRVRVAVRQAPGRDIRTGTIRDHLPDFTSY